MNQHKTNHHPSLVDRIQMTIRGLAHCLESYLTTLRSVAPRP